MHHGKRLLASLAVTALAVAGILSVGAAFGAGSAKTVTTVGGATFKRNVAVSDTQHFAPGAITVRSGQKVTWRYATRGGEPHTISIVRRSQRPNSPNCGKVCDYYFRAHGAQENGPPKHLVVNKGRPGLNEFGDSIVQLPHRSVTAVISAKPGTTLYYICAIHPWMQGSIKVLGSAAALPRFTG